MSRDGGTGGQCTDTSHPRAPTQNAFQYSQNSIQSGVDAPTSPKDADEGTSVAHVASFKPTPGSQPKKRAGGELHEVSWICIIVRYADVSANQGAGS